MKCKSFDGGTRIKNMMLYLNVDIIETTKTDILNIYLLKKYMSTSRHAYAFTVAIYKLDAHIIPLTKKTRNKDNYVIIYTYLL